MTLWRNENEIKSAQKVEREAVSKCTGQQRNVVCEKERAEMRFPAKQPGVNSL